MVLEDFQPIWTCYNENVLEKFKRILQEDCRITWDQPVVVGVSGGADSLTLLHLFLRVKVPVWVVYFDHQLRRESRDELQVVHQLADVWGAEGFIAGQENVRLLAEQTHCSLEAAARQARYRFLFKKAEEKDAQAVAVGHTADDQVETVLMNLIRGSGLDGMRGMDYRIILRDFSTSIPVIRPLLSFWRTEVEQYCQENGIQPLQDVTNRSVEFTRNRVRLDLIPKLQEYNPQIKNRLWTMSRVVNDHLRVVKPVIEKTFQEVCVDRFQGQWLTFSAKRLRELPEALLSLVLREAVKDIKPTSENIDWQSLNLAIKEIQSGRRSGIIQLGDGIELLFAQNWIYLKDESSNPFSGGYPSILADKAFVLAGEGELNLGGEWFLKAELIQVVEVPSTWKDNLFEAWLDAQKVHFPLQVRVWRRGERFRPLGMRIGSVKIADFLTEKKVPRPLRSQYPVVVSGDQVVWLPGLQIADQARITPDTRHVLHLKLVHI